MANVQITDLPNITTPISESDLFHLRQGVDGKGTLAEVRDGILKELVVPVFIGSPQTLNADNSFHRKAYYLGDGSSPGSFVVNIDSGSWVEDSTYIVFTNIHAGSVNSNLTINPLNSTQIQTADGLITSGGSIVLEPKQTIILQRIAGDSWVANILDGGISYISGGGALGTIPGSDLNLITETGNYEVIDSPAVNTPPNFTGSGSVCTHFQWSGNYASQIFYVNNNNTIYTRSYVLGTWSDWVRVDNADILTGFNGDGAFCPQDPSDPFDSYNPDLINESGLYKLTSESINTPPTGGFDGDYVWHMEWATDGVSPELSSVQTQVYFANRGGVGEGTISIRNKNSFSSGWTDWYQVGEVVDNLTSTDQDKSLSANQGSVLKGITDSLSSSLTGLSSDVLSNTSDIADLQTNKFDKSSVVDNLVSTSSTDALSSNQGNVLKGITDSLNSSLTSLSSDVADNTSDITDLQTDKFDKSSVVDNLVSTSATDALSANQGNVLNALIAAVQTQADNTLAGFDGSNTFCPQDPSDPFNSYNPDLIDEGGLYKLTDESINTPATGGFIGDYVWHMEWSTGIQTQVYFSNRGGIGEGIISIRNKNSFSGGWTDWYDVGAVVNNLTSTDTDKALSAQQGFILKALSDTNKDDITTLFTNVAQNALDITAKLEKPLITADYLNCVNFRLRTSKLSDLTIPSTQASDSAFTIGPTGSGSDYEWSALDGLPASASFVEVNAVFNLTANNFTLADNQPYTADTKLEVFQTGVLESDALRVVDQKVLIIVGDAFDHNPQTLVSQTIKLPLDGSNVTNCNWTYELVEAVLGVPAEGQAFIGPTLSFVFMGYGDSDN